MTNSELKHVESIKAFDPRIPFTSKEEQENASIIWSSRSIDYVYKCINDGVGYRGHPFYRGKAGIRNADLVYQYTEEELEEILLCMDDINYFAENYVYLKAGEQVSKITLRPYQKKLLSQYQDNRFNIVLQARQTGKTTTTAIYIAWFCIFNIDKTVAILATIATIAGEVFGKVKGIIAALPFYMKPGTTAWGPENVSFDNGCRIITRPLRPDCIQGYTVDVIFWDEVAYAKNAEEVWINIYPTISSIPDSKIFLTSTPNGKNFFWKLWDGALRKLNKLIPFRVDYWEAPKYMDINEWIEQEKANLGEAGFNQQYALSFDAKIRQLLKQDTINYLSKVAHNWKGYQDLESGFDDSFKWSDVFEYDLSNDFFTISVDVSEGLGLDSSTIKIHKLMPKISGKIDEVNISNNISLLNVGIFDSNIIGIKDFAMVIMRLIGKMDQEKVKLIIERNTYGDQLMTHMEYLEDDYPELEIEFETFAKFYRSKESLKPEKGVRVNSKSKRIGVNRFKQYIDDKTFIETEENSIGQIREFGEDAKGNYKATTGHDDLVMPMVNLAYYLEQDFQEWKEFVNYFLDSIEDSKIYNIRIEPNIRYINRINTKVNEMMVAERAVTGRLASPDEFVYDINEDIHYLTKNSTGSIKDGDSENGTEYDVINDQVSVSDNIYASMNITENKIVEQNIKNKINENAPIQEVIDYVMDHESRTNSNWKDNYRNIDDSPESLLDMF